MSRIVSGYMLAKGDVFVLPTGKVSQVAHTEPSDPGTRKIVTTYGDRMTFTPADIVRVLDPAGTFGAVLDAVLALEPAQSVTVWRGGPDGALYL